MVSQKIVAGALKDLLSSTVDMEVHGPILVRAEIQEEEVLEVEVKAALTVVVVVVVTPAEEPRFTTLHAEVVAALSTSVLTLLESLATWATVMSKSPGSTPPSKILN